MGRRPTPAVLRWFKTQDRMCLFITTISEAEILLGIQSLPEGKRKTLLAHVAKSVFAEFRDQVWPFDELAARAYAHICANKRRSGRPISQSDAMIAGICQAQGAAIATRNVSDFENCGIEVIDPWNS
jgi:predicted nucleic acid-binding protein